MENVGLLVKYGARNVLHSPENKWPERGSQQSECNCIGCRSLRSVLPPSSLLNVRGSCYQPWQRHTPNVSISWQDLSLVAASDELFERCWTADHEAKKSVGA